MKVAVPSDDSTRIADHFGRSRLFLIFELKDGHITNREVRINSHARHASTGCSSGQSCDSGDHDHSGIVQALAGCEAVLCHGMGRRAAEALIKGGIRPFFVPDDRTAEEALSLYLGGELSPASGQLCAGHVAW